MPGPVSDSNPGPPDGGPYVPAHCYSKGPKQCPCGHHEGFHNDKGQCSHAWFCRCPGLPAECLTPMEDM